MSRCNRCNIEILDDTIVCPICDGVIKRSEEGIIMPMYPDVAPTMKKRKFFVKLFIFVSVCLEIFFILLNRKLGSSVRWSLICGVALAYICFTLVYSFLYSRDHRRRIMYQSIGVMILCGILDYLIGYIGWSFGIAMPVIFMGIDMVIFILMIVNKHQFQFYLMMQIVNTILNTILLIIVLTTELANFTILAWVSEGLSVLLLAGTVVFGDKKVISELTRRFRI